MTIGSLDTHVNIGFDHVRLGRNAQFDRHRIKGLDHWSVRGNDLKILNQKSLGLKRGRSRKTLRHRCLILVNNRRGWTKVHDLATIKRQRPSTNRANRRHVVTDQEYGPVTTS